MNCSPLFISKKIPLVSGKFRNIMTGHGTFHGCLSSIKCIVSVTIHVKFGTYMRLLHVYCHPVNCKFSCCICILYVSFIEIYLFKKKNHLKFVTYRPITLSDCL